MPELSEYYADYALEKVCAQFVMCASFVFLLVILNFLLNAVREEL